MTRKLLVTGGSGFIGSSFIRHVLKEQNTCQTLVNLDLLTYAAHPDNVKPILHDPRYHFVHGDICDGSLVAHLLDLYEIDTIVHFAAATHVDNSIKDPLIFFHTNVGGTLVLLEQVRLRPHIHFHHISTDEVYGSLKKEDPQFSENSLYSPSSPYSASKAAADHFVRAYAHTYGLKTTISHCTNNYGPCQHKEKLIPTILSHLLKEKPIPIYGTGENVRDWLFVDDHSAAIWKILTSQMRNETFGLGGNTEYTNLDLTYLLIDLFAQIYGKPAKHYRDLISFVQDRPGHDLRYGMNTKKIEHALQWKPLYPLEEGLKHTITWYLNHQERLA